jgi:hypothetical protein
MSSGYNSALRRASVEAGMVPVCDRGGTTGLAEGLSCPEKDR